MIWKDRDILRPKNHTRKTDKIHKDFWIMSSLLYNFLSKNVPMPLTRNKRIFSFSAIVKLFDPKLQVVAEILQETRSNYNIMLF